jgi:hypothetical protein
MTLNSSGVRDTGRALQINRNTVCAVLKKMPERNPYFLTVGEFNALSKLEAEYVFQQRWTNFGVLSARKAISAGRGMP